MEERVEKKPQGGIKWSYVLLCFLVFLMASAWFFVFRVNRFMLTVELAGPEEMVVEYGEPFIDPGVRIWFSGSHILQEGIQPKRATVTTVGEVDPAQKGKYVLQYSCVFYGWQGSTQRTVRIVDTESPVITLVSDPDLRLEADSIYKEEGFQAIDNYDGDITDQVVRTEEFGRIFYSVLDSSGNPAMAQREIPNYDPFGPEITLTGGEHVTLPLGIPYVEPGFAARDNVDGDVTQHVEVKGEVDCFKPGRYPITYTVTDSYENRTQIIRTVEIPEYPAPQIQQPQAKTVYLTFDDGPGPYTEGLLDVLAKYGVKATFFVMNTGYNSVMNRIVAEGHSIGIHSVTHNYEQIYSSPEAYFADLYGMREMIRQHTGIETSLLRFPGGSSNLISNRFSPGIMTFLTEAVTNAGFRYFDWNVDSNDAGGAKSAREVTENVIQGIQEQSCAVVLQHDIHPFSVEAVEDIILWGLENGYTFQALNPNSPVFAHDVAN